VAVEFLRSGLCNTGQVSSTVEADIRGGGK